MRASIVFYLLVSHLGSTVQGQNASSNAASSASSASAVASSASSLSVSASQISSSASAAASSASALSASSQSSAASSLSSVASSAASVASSLSSVASSISSVASSIASANLSSTTSIASTSSALTTTTATTSTVSTASLTSSFSSSSQTSTTSPTRQSSSSPSSSPRILTTTSTSISFAATTYTSEAVIPTTSANGAVGLTTITTYVVQSSAASTYISPYTTTQGSVAANSATTQPGTSSGSGGGLSSGAKAGIGAGVAVAVLAGAIFGGWYAWYMRRRRRRDSISASDRYPPSSIPSMMGPSSFGAVGGAVGAGHMSEKSYGQSELPSPALTNTSPRSPNYLLPPVAGGVSSMNSVSKHQSDQSVSDYSGNEGKPPGSDHGGEPAPGYSPLAAAGIVHELGESDRTRQEQQQSSQEYGHQRTLSNNSYSERSEGGVPTGAYHNSSDRGGYWQDPQQQHNTLSELQGSPGLSQADTAVASQSPRDVYQSMAPEVPLHRRVPSGDRPPPFRAGHLTKQAPGGAGAGYGPSRNF